MFVHGGHQKWCPQKMEVTLILKMCQVCAFRFDWGMTQRTEVLKYFNLYFNFQLYWQCWWAGRTTVTNFLLLCSMHLPFSLYTSFSNPPLPDWKALQKTGLTLKDNQYEVFCVLDLVYIVLLLYLKPDFPVSGIVHRVNYILLRSVTG